VIRVLIADDHAVVRQGLRTYLELQEDIAVVGEAADGQAAIDVAGRTAPDVILLDLAMPDRDGLGALPRLRELGRVIVLTSFGEDDRLFAALRGGAVGFLLKDTEPAELARAIRAAHAGQSPLSPAVAARVIDQLAQAGRPRAIDQLTPREREVLRLIARGYLYKEIALRLDISPKTVEAHVSAVLRKLQLSSRHELSRWAVERRLVD
jgi:two-component system, NarL family, response regulator LiaR